MGRDYARRGWASKPAIILDSYPPMHTQKHQLRVAGRFGFKDEAP
jgi:hypothetical protein